MTDLGGSWRAAPGERELTKVFAEPDHDDRAWSTIPVPGHWRDTAAFADHDGSVLLRRAFERPRLGWDRRAWLELAGIFYFGDVWLDGDYLGTTEGYFVEHAFEITEQLLTDEHHVVALEVASPPQTDRTAKRTITGVFGHWDAMDTSWNPGGVWRPVTIHETGPIRIARHRVTCTEATAERARVRVDLLLDAGSFPPDAATVHIRIEHDGVELTRVDHDLVPARGASELRLELDVADPPRWWPAGLGAQPLVDVVTEVRVGDTASDTAARRTGLRTITVDDWIVSVNGRRVFIRGANHAPTSRALGSVDPATVRHDVELALAADLNLLRVHAHVAHPELYAAADELGLLVWQDFPLQWGYGQGARRSATQQARAMVDQLAHHPSVALWCAHNEPLAVELTNDPITPKVAARLATSMFLPSWNKSVLDRSVARVVHHADPSRFVDVHSGVLPGPASLGTDSHLYFGWYHGDATQLPRAARAFPRLVRFVSEFGAQAVPDSAEFCAPHRWPNLDWDELEAHHCLQRRLLESRVPSGEHATFDSWRVATQQYQADLLQLQIEDLRRIKYQPTGGYCLFSFADPHPAISWSILGHDRAPKAAYRAVAAASRPLLALVDHRTGDVHVVNDTDASFPDAVVEVAVGDVLSVFGGVVEADSLTWVGRVDLAADRPVITRLHVAGQPPIEHRPAGDPGVRRDAWATSEGRIRLAETARK